MVAIAASIILNIVFFFILNVFIVNNLEGFEGFEEFERFERFEGFEGFYPQNYWLNSLTPF